MTRNEKIELSLQEKLRRCRHAEDFMEIGFYYSENLTEDPDCRVQIWTDGYYLIKIADQGNSYFSYDGQYQES